MRSRSDHLAWAKARAIEYIDLGQPHLAIAFMLSDLGKHDAWDGEVLETLGVLGTFEALRRGVSGVCAWVEGFN